MCLTLKLCDLFRLESLYMQCRIELFSLAHWRTFFLYMTLGIIFVLVLIRCPCSSSVVFYWCDGSVCWCLCCGHENYVPFSGGRVWEGGVQGSQVGCCTTSPYTTMSIRGWMILWYGWTINFVNFVWYVFSPEQIFWCTILTNRVKPLKCNYSSTLVIQGLLEAIAAMMPPQMFQTSLKKIYLKTKK